MGEPGADATRALRAATGALFAALLAGPAACGGQTSLVVRRDAGRADAQDAAAPDVAPDAIADVEPEAGCAANETACAGTCVDTSTDLDDCGGCGHECTAPQNASATCQAGTCGFTCNAGFVLVGGSCVVPPPPRPLAPLSTSRVTRRRPTLHWALPAGVSDATVDLCLDRACTEPIGAPAHITGTSYAPPSDLPAGMVYWRLHPSTLTSVTSATWEFVVGARSKPVDTSWGTTLDVNGDGYADVAVGAPYLGHNVGRAFVYLGGAGGLTTSPAVTLTGPLGGRTAFGDPIASAGDVNGDGYADLVVAAPRALGLTGRVYVYLGGAKGVVASPAATWLDPEPQSGFGGSFASAGDVNGDGYADVVVGAPSAANGAGRVYVYLGGSSGPAASPAIALTGPDLGGFGDSVASAGDVNGDGYGDVVVSAESIDRAYLYLGSAGGLGTSPAVTWVAPDIPSSFGNSVASADVNGDGYADVVVGADRAQTEIGCVYLYLGGPDGPAASPTLTLLPPDANEFFGFALASAGDVNGDGYADVAVSSSGASSDTGGAYVYLGGANGLATSPAATLTAAGSDTYFGFALAGAGDVNGDGYSEVIVGDPATSSDVGSAYVFSGSASGLATSPAATLVGPSGGIVEFGESVCGATN
jgi:FG-GAP repeat/FG-GAP-like repeat/Stigma-specific protein, Stig1